MGSATEMSSSFLRLVKKPGFRPNFNGTMLLESQNVNQNPTAINVTPSTFHYFDLRMKKWCQLARKLQWNAIDILESQIRPFQKGQHDSKLSQIFSKLPVNGTTQGQGTHQRQTVNGVFHDDLHIKLNPFTPGSCLFASVSDQLMTIGKQISHKDLRKQCVEFLKENPLFIDNETHACNFILSSSNAESTAFDWERYLCELQKPTTHGDHMTLQALSIFLNVQFLVTSKNTSSEIKVHLISPVRSYKRDIPILILGHYDELDREHYVSLVPCSEQTLERLLLSVEDKSMRSSIAIELQSNSVKTTASDDNTNCFRGATHPFDGSKSCLHEPTSICSDTSKISTSRPMSLDQNVPIVYDKEHVENSKFFVQESDKSDYNTMHDIGSLLARNVDTRKLPTEVKMHIIQFEHPVESTLYPTTMMNGCLRRFKPPWLLEHPWLQYSWHSDGAFCKACSLFSPTEISSNKLGMFVSKPFSKWTKKFDACRKHASSQYHLDAMARMCEFKDAVNNPKTAIENVLDSERMRLIERNRHVIASLFKVVVLCGKQGIALRGHRDDNISWDNNTVDYVSADASSQNQLPRSNVGNFIELVRFRAETDHLLAEHLKSAPHNSQYTSKTIQNELIDVIGCVIREQLLNEITQAKLFSVMADEVTDVSNKEQVSVVIRYVDAALQVKEVFLDLVHTERITGDALANLLMNRLIEWQLPLENLRGQAYDGASNMSGKKNGCQAKIREKSPLAFYTHCASHQLSLAVVSSCNLREARNAHAVISEISRFFSFSPKRAAFFERVIDSSEDTGSAHRLKDVCRTRWIERVDAYETFFELYMSIVTTMQAVISPSAFPQFGVDWNWDNETVTRAQGFLHSVTCPTFLVASYVLMSMLSILRVVTVKLQGRCTDILKAFDLVQDVAVEFNLMRMNVDEEFAIIFTEIKKLGAKVSVELTVPRIVGRQTQRANTPSTNAEEYFRRTVMIPLLDHMTTELEARFGDNHRTVIQLLCLVPACIASSEIGFRIAVPEKLLELVATYKCDLPAPDMFHVEYASWVRHWQQNEAHGTLPNTLQETILQCDSDRYRNIFMLLKIALTMPVTTCENERSHSQVKLVKTYMRSSMTDDRLGALMMMKVHRRLAESLSDNELVTRFEQRHPRRMLLKCLLT